MERWFGLTTGPSHPAGSFDTVWKLERAIHRFIAHWNEDAKRDAPLLMSLFRDRLLARLLASHAISQELVRKFLAWRHPGFSAHLGEAIAPEEKQRLEDTAAYLVRTPLSLQKLVYLDGEQAVLYRSRMSPFLGRNFEAMDPLEWLARLSD